MSVSPRLLLLYRRTDYVVDGLVHVAVGRRSDDTDALLRRMNARSAVLLTAANPRRRPMPEGWNNRPTRRLAQVVRRLRTRPAQGRLGAWREGGLLVCGDPRALAALGRRFRQNALVLLSQGRAARLLVLDTGAKRGSAGR